MLIRGHIARRMTNKQHFMLTFTARPRTWKAKRSNIQASSGTSTTTRKKIAFIDKIDCKTASRSTGATGTMVQRRRPHCAKVLPLVMHAISSWR
jgi:hypothetical protein